MEKEQNPKTEEKINNKTESQDISENESQDISENNEKKSETKIRLSFFILCLDLIV